jgi:hypothetical protein
VNIWPSLIEEFRAIADKPTNTCGGIDISPDEFVALRHRSNLVEAKVIALEEEIRGAAEELVHRLARRPQ